MKKLLRIIGRILSLLYPFKFHQKLKGGIEVIYTSWITSGFSHCGDNVKFGLKVRIGGLSIFGWEMIFSMEKAEL